MFVAPEDYSLPYGEPDGHSAPTPRPDYAKWVFHAYFFVFCPVVIAICVWVIGRAAQ